MLDESSHDITLVTAIIVAIVALISTVVGATIGAVTNYVLAVRRERADSDKDSRSHAIEVSRAARMIDAELLRGQAAAVMCIEQRHWWSGDVQPLATEAWKKYSAIVVKLAHERVVFFVHRHTFTFLAGELCDEIRRSILALA
jgi:hypothetical protein